MTLTEGLNRKTTQGCRRAILKKRAASRPKNGWTFLRGRQSYVANKKKGEPF